MDRRTQIGGFVQRRTPENYLLTENFTFRKLRNVDWLSSVWRITTVNPEIERFKLEAETVHPAPFPEELAYRLIMLFSRRGDWVLDPFCGSGTTNFMALCLGRNTIGYDVEPRYIELAKKRCKGKGIFYCKSSESMEEIESNQIQLCVTSPPYLNVRNYSQNPRDIGNMKNPYPALERVLTEIYRVLAPSGTFCLNVAGVAIEGELSTFPFDMVYMCKKIGFKFRSSIIWDKGILIKEWNLQHNEIAENHEYIWIFRK
jgi:DNA modification methylase